VAWSVENVSEGPLLAGTVRAELSNWGATVWEETQPLVLGAAPNGRGTISLSVPPIPADFGDGGLTLRVENGFGATVSMSSAIRSRFGLGRRGESGVHAGRMARLSCPDEPGRWKRDRRSAASKASPAAASYSVLPGAQATLRFPFTVPLDVRGGLHGGTLSLPHSPSVSFSVRVAPPKFEFAVEDRPYTAGEPLPVILRNTGGSRSSGQVALRLEALRRGGNAVLVQATAAVELIPGGETTINLDLPSHLASGSYGLSGTADDAASGVTAELNRSITVAGTSATLEVTTDQSLYVTGSEVVSSASLTNGPRALSGGLLFWELVQPCGVGGGGEGARILGAAAPALASYHIETWDGSSWVERAVRHLGPQYETVLATWRRTFRPTASTGCACGKPVANRVERGATRHLARGSLFRHLGHHRLRPGRLQSHDLTATGVCPSVRSDGVPVTRAVSPAAGEVRPSPSPDDLRSRCLDPTRGSLQHPEDQPALDPRHTCPRARLERWRCRESSCRGLGEVRCRSGPGLPYRTEPASPSRVWRGTRSRGGARSGAR
jgi:hypothetical protein